jgi:hypothetical protein
MAAGEKISVLVKCHVRARRQPHLAQHTAWEPVRQRRQERLIARGEPHLVLVELAFQHGDLMTQRQGLRVLVPLAHRQ